MSLTQDLQHTYNALTRTRTMRKDKQDELDTLDQSISALSERMIRLEEIRDKPQSNQLDKLTRLYTAVFNTAAWGEDRCSKVILEYSTPESLAESKVTTFNDNAEFHAVLDMCSEFLELYPLISFDNMCNYLLSNFKKHWR